METIAVLMTLSWHISIVVMSAANMLTCGNLFSKGRKFLIQFVCISGIVPNHIDQTGDSQIDTLVLQGAQASLKLL